MPSLIRDLATTIVPRRHLRPGSQALNTDDGRSPRVSKVTVDPRHLFLRSEANPILTARNLPYPVNSIFNPGAVQAGDDTLLLARAEQFNGQSHLVVARSADGVTNWRFDATHDLVPDPANHPEDLFGIEDPRIVASDELGYLGRVVRVTVARPGDPRPPATEIEWLDVWDHQTIVAGVRGMPRVSALVGEDALVAARAFANLRCSQCGGTGQGDLREGAGARAGNAAAGACSASTRASNTSYGIFARRAANARRRELALPPAPGAPAPVTRSEWRPLELRYTSACVQCHCRLVASATVQARKVGERWEMRCPDHRG